MAEEVEAAIHAALPGVESVQTHLEPLGEQVEVSELASGDAIALITRVVADICGHPPRELRMLQTDEGLVAFLTIGLDPSLTLAAAHARASEIEERIRQERPEIADVHVHTEP